MKNIIEFLSVFTFDVITISFSGLFAVIAAYEGQFGFYLLFSAIFLFQIYRLRQELKNE